MWEKIEIGWGWKLASLCSFPRWWCLMAMVPKYFGLPWFTDHWPWLPLFAGAIRGSHCHQGQDLDTSPKPSHLPPPPEYPQRPASYQVLRQETHKATQQVPPLGTIEMGQGERGTRPSVMVPVWHTAINSSCTALIALCSIHFPMGPLTWFTGAPYSHGAQFGKPSLKGLSGWWEHVCTQFETYIPSSIPEQSDYYSIEKGESDITKKGRHVKQGTPKRRIFVTKKEGNLH